MNDAPERSPGGVLPSSAKVGTSPAHRRESVRGAGNQTDVRGVCTSSLGPSAGARLLVELEEDGAEEGEADVGVVLGAHGGEGRPGRRESGPNANVSQAPEAAADMLSEACWGGDLRASLGRGCWVCLFHSAQADCNRRHGLGGIKGSA